ncbi:MAG: hypothetical protein RL258_200 [Pseudomonadota bacterium]
MAALSWPAPDVAVVQIARLDRGNAFDAQLVQALHNAIIEAAAQPLAQTLIFRADGPDFSTGMDLSNLESETDETLAARFIAIEDLLAAVWSSRLRTVAFVHGRAWGAAADLVVACDLRIALPNTSFRFPGVQFGLVLGTRRLACRIGSDIARQILLEGQTVAAEKAAQLGLIHRIVDAFDLKDLPRLMVDAPTQAMIHAASRAADDGYSGVTMGGAESPADAHRGLSFDRQALMASARRPGLRQRILDYRAQLKRDARPAPGAAGPDDISTAIR